MEKPRVVVTGAGGFVGRRVVRELELRGREVVALSGRRDGDLGEAGCVAGLREKIGAADGFIHLVGIIRERGGNTFERAHVAATRHALGIARGVGAKKFVHMSALGARAGAPSAYHRTKHEAEVLVRTSGLPYTIFRPSSLFGDDCPFLDLLRKLARSPLIVPVIGSGARRMQPIHVDDVAGFFVDALEKPEMDGRAVALGGPRGYSLNEILDRIARAELGRARLKFHVPRLLMRPVVAAMGILPNPPITREEFVMLGEDNVCEMQETLRVFGRTLVEFGAWLDRRGSPAA